MSLKKAKCPICNKSQEVDLEDGKTVYRCKACTRFVRFIKDDKKINTKSEKVSNKEETIVKKSVEEKISKKEETKFKRDSKKKYRKR